MNNKMIEGNYVAEHDEIFCGVIKGNLTVKSGVTFNNLGTVCGVIIVEQDAVLEHRGMAKDSVIGPGCIKVWGVVNGAIMTAKYHIYKNAVVNGVHCEQDDIR